MVHNLVMVESFIFDGTYICELIHNTYIINMNICCWPTKSRKVTVTQITKVSQLHLFHFI